MSYINSPHTTITQNGSISWNYIYIYMNYINSPHTTISQNGSISWSAPSTIPPSLSVSTSTDESLPGRPKKKD